VLGQSKDQPDWLRRYDQQKAILISKFQNFTRSRDWIHTVATGFTDGAERALDLMHSPSQVFGSTPQTSAQAIASLARGYAVLEYAQNPRHDPCHPWAFCGRYRRPGESMDGCLRDLSSGRSPSLSVDPYSGGPGNYFEVCPADRYQISSLSSGLSGLGQADTIPVSDANRARAKSEIEPSMVGALVLLGMGALVFYLLTDAGR